MMERDDTLPGGIVAAKPAHAAADPRRIPLAEIIGGDREVLIDHAGQLYRLRLTSKGKLILTK